LNIIFYFVLGCDNKIAKLRRVTTTDTDTFFKLPYSQLWQRRMVRTWFLYSETSMLN